MLNESFTAAAYAGACQPSRDDHMQPITRNTLLIVSLAALPLAATTFVRLMWPDAHWVGPTGTYFGVNFVNFWTAGALANEGRLAVGYDYPAFVALVHEWFAPATKFTNLSYPPSLVPLLQPFALLPYLAALALWMAACVAAFVWACLGRIPRAADTALLAGILLSPILVNNLAFGSIGPFIALAFVGALRLLPTSPIAAGVLIGLLTVKPQIGVLLALGLVVLGQWRAIGVAIATALALLAVSLLAYGVEPWQRYLTETAALQVGFLSEMRGFYALHMATVYAGAWAVGANETLAMALHVLSAVSAGLATLFVLRLDVAWSLRAAVLALGSVMIMPYGLGSDLAVPLAALVWAAQERELPATRVGQAVIGLLWVVPFPLIFMMQARGVPIAQIAIIATFVWLVASAWARAGYVWPSWVPLRSRPV